MELFEENWVDERRIRTRNNLICIALSILALCVMVSVLRYSRDRDEAMEQYYETLQGQLDSTESTAAAPALGEGVIGKLQQGRPIHILIVGDGIGAGVGLGAEETAWPQLLAARLEAVYGSKVTVTNTSLERAGSYGSYVCAMEQEASDVDLVILCCGSWDATDTIAVRYEALVRGICQRYPKAAVLSVLAHGLSSSKAAAMEAVCEHYDIPVADLITAFGKDPGSLVQTHDVYPSGAGHQRYGEVLEAAIAGLVSEGRATPGNPEEPLNADALTFRNFEYIGVEQFTRTGNTFRLTGAMEGTIGIDYHNVLGKNGAKILADGKLLDTKSSTHNAQVPLRRISLVAEDVRIGDYLEIVFTRPEETDAFRGIILNRK